MRRSRQDLGSRLRGVGSAPSRPGPGGAVARRLFRCQAWQVLRPGWSASRSAACPGLWRPARTDISPVRASRLPLQLEHTSAWGGPQPGTAAPAHPASFTGPACPPTWHRVWLRAQSGPWGLDRPTRGAVGISWAPGGGGRLSHPSVTIEHLPRAETSRVSTFTVLIRRAAGWRVPGQRPPFSMPLFSSRSLSPHLHLHRPLRDIAVLGLGGHKGLRTESWPVSPCRPHHLSSSPRS